MSYSCIVLVMQLMGILMFQLLICLCPEGWFLGNNFSDQNLEVISKGILQFIFLLVSTIEVTNQLTYSLTQLKSIFQVVHQAIKCLLVICNHAHIEFNFIMALSAVKSLTSWMASLSVKFWSSTWMLISFSHNWKIKLAVAEYPPFNLLILGLHAVCRIPAPPPSCDIQVDIPQD